MAGRPAVIMRDGRALTVVSPPPPAGLNPNRAKGWQGRARMARQARADANLAATAAMRAAGVWRGPLFTGPCRVRITWGLRAGENRRDRDNALAMLKPVFDGLTDAGVWADDRDMWPMPVEWERDTGGGYVRLVIEPMET